MQIIVVAAFLIALGLQDRPSLWATPAWVAPAGALAYVLSAYVAGRMLAHAGLRRLMRTGQTGRGTRLAATAVQGYLLLGLAGLILLAGWGDWTQRLLGPAAWLPLTRELLQILPFFAAAIACWRATYPLERCVQEHARHDMALAGEPVLPVWTRRQYLTFNIRQQLLFIATPILLLVLVNDVLGLLQPVIGQTAVGVIGGATGLTVFLLAPCLIVVIWGTAPFPPGELRDRLEQFCRRIHLRYRKLLVWRTHGVIANAGVLGVLRPARYVLLSDALLARMDPEAIESIFAHEAGHVLHHHILYMVLFTFGLLGSVATLSDWTANLLRLSDGWIDWPMLGIMAGAWLVLFGALSRRLEWHADAFAAYAAAPAAPGTSNPLDPHAPLSWEGVHLFARALTTVGRLNGSARSGWNFRHGSIDRRIGLLVDHANQGHSFAQINARVRRIKAAVWLLFALGVAGSAATIIAGK